MSVHPPSLDAWLVSAEHRDDQRRCARRSHAHRTTALVTALIALVSSGPVARAGDLVVESNGICPKATEVQQRLHDLQPPGPATQRWTVRVRQGDHALGIRLFAGDALALSRSLQSGDCGALADAIAIIVRTHLESLLFQAPAAASPASPRKPPRAAPSGVARTSLEPRAGRRYWRFSAALSGGAELLFAPDRAAALGQLEAAWRPPELAPMVVRLVGTIGSPTEQASAWGRIERRQWAVRAEVGARWHLGRSWWVQLCAGAGSLFSRVTALDSQTPSAATGIHFLVGGGGLVGLRLSRALALRAELGSHLLPSRDRYLFAPTQVIGRSPRAVALLNLGLEFTLEKRAGQ